jgi:hypothetical protein
MADQARRVVVEDYLVAVLEREVSARNAAGAELRMNAAGFPARKRSRTSIGTRGLPPNSREQLSLPEGSRSKHSTWCCSRLRGASSLFRET